MIFRLANQSDDCQLRNLMRETIVPGHIKIAYSREPDFFEAYRDIDDSTQVIVAEDNGQIGGVACRSIRNLLVNGKPSSVGYLSGLRLRPSVQNSTTLARGYAYLKTLHADNKAPVYLTTIIHGNSRAKDILTSGRASLPAYIPMGNYLTHVCPVKRRAVSPVVQDEVTIQAATQISPHELTDYLTQEGSRRQFFPVHKSNGQTSGILRSIGLDNVFVAQRQSKIVGTIAVWNQEKAKQHIIAGYSLIFRALRPLLNLSLWARNFHTLPKVGEELRYGAAALICVRNNDLDVFKALLWHALSMAAARGLHQLAVGLHERDPLVPALNDLTHVVYRSWLYLVCWDGNPLDDTFDKTLIPYLELGTL